MPTKAQPGVAPGYRTLAEGTTLPVSCEILELEGRRGREMPQVSKASGIY